MDQSNPSGSETNTSMQSTHEDKTVAIVAYLHLIGFIIALILHGQKKTLLGAYHLRQSLGLMLTSVVIGFLVFIPILGWIAMPILGILVLVMWVMGLIAAVNGERKPTLVLGEKYQEWFKNAFD